MSNSKESLSVEVEKLHKLHLNGAITSEEFQKAKAKLLEKNNDFGPIAKKLINFIIGITIFIVVATFLTYVFVIVPSNQKMEEDFKLQKEKHEKDFKDFEKETDKQMEEFRLKHGFK